PQLRTADRYVCAGHLALLCAGRRRHLSAAARTARSAASVSRARLSGRSCRVHRLRDRVRRERAHQRHGEQRHHLRGDPGRTSGLSGLLRESPAILSRSLKFYERRRRREPLNAPFDLRALDDTYSIFLQTIASIFFDPSKSGCYSVFWIRYSGEGALKMLVYGALRRRGFFLHSSDAEADSGEHENPEGFRLRVRTSRRIARRQAAGGGRSRSESRSEEVQPQS